MSSGLTLAPIAGPRAEGEVSKSATSPGARPRVSGLTDVLNVAEAAGLLRINVKTLRDAIARQQVPGVVRIGRVIRLSRACLLEWFGGKHAASRSR